MSDPPLILVVDDEQSYRDALTIALQREGFLVETAADGPEALARFDATRPALVLLDVMLPKISGVDVCRDIRARSRVPIIMVTARNSEIDAVVGLEVGADDYVTKPFRLRELIARARGPPTRSRGRRRRSRPARRGGDRRCPPRRRPARGLRARLLGCAPAQGVRAARVADGERGRVLTRDVLIDRIWGPNYFGDTKTLDVHIKRLRAKLESDSAHPARIVTVRGVGYRYERAAASH